MYSYEAYTSYEASSRLDTRTGAGVTVKETQRDNTTGTARYLGVDVVEVETGKTAEAVVHKGAMVQTPTPPPPPNQDR